MRQLLAKIGEERERHANRERDGTRTAGQKNCTRAATDVTGAVGDGLCVAHVTGPGRGVGIAGLRRRPAKAKQRDE